MDASRFPSFSRLLPEEMLKTADLEKEAYIFLEGGLIFNSIISFGFPEVLCSLQTLPLIFFIE